MSAIPDVTQSITDGALALVSPSGKVSATIGASSSGTVNTVYVFSDPTVLHSTLGEGPAVESAALDLALGGGTKFVVRVDSTSVPGVAGSVTHAGTGASVATITGAPYDAYQVIITMVAAGTNPAAGTATFTYSLDNGNTTSPVIALATSGIYAIPNTNLTVTFSAASLVAADTYTFTCSAPGYDGTSLTAAFNALVADPRTWKFVHVCGSAATASAQATICTTVNTLLATAATNYRYTYAIMETPDLGDGTTGDSALGTAFANFASVREDVNAGTARLTSVLSGRIYRRSAGWVESARRHLAAISESSARVRSGPHPEIVSLDRDEQIHRGLDALRFTTLRTIIGKQGFYTTQGRIMSAASSDFVKVPHREVMDVACTVTRAVLLDYLEDDIRLNPISAPVHPGGIDEKEAVAIEKRVLALLRVTLLDPNHASDVRVVVNRTDNIISTTTLRVQVRVLPKGYATYISVDLGFINPNITLG